MRAIIEQCGARYGGMHCCTGGASGAIEDGASPPCWIYARYNGMDIVVRAGVWWPCPMKHRGFVAVQHEWWQQGWGNRLEVPSVVIALEAVVSRVCRLGPYH
jgi:hypothetical protein